MKAFVAGVSYAAFKACLGLALPGTYITSKVFLQVMQGFLSGHQGTKM